MTLPPTIHERLARCNEQVFIDGLIKGAAVELFIDGDRIEFVAATNAQTLNVPPLNAGSVLRARQNPGDGFTPFSANVVVEEVATPPKSAPGTPEAVSACSGCILINHTSPGARVEVFLNDVLVGEGTANRKGFACVSVDLASTKGEPVTGLRARQIVCGAPGPFASIHLENFGPLPKPEITGLLFSCQTIVSLNNIRPGSRVWIESNNGDLLRAVCTCWDRVLIEVSRPLLVGERIRVRCYYSSDPCAAEGPWSDWREVSPPDERIKPEILEAIIEGDQVVRVANQVRGANLTFEITDTAGAVTTYGPRPTGEEAEISLSEPVVRDHKIVVIQTLCGVSVASDPVIVQPPPPEVVAPVLIAPLVSCGRAVQVSNLLPGARVRLYQDSILIGLAWSGVSHSITVQTSPVLFSGSEIVARQSIGDVESLPSNPIQVEDRRFPYRPRIAGRVAYGDRSVLVSGITPGAKVIVREQDLYNLSPSKIIGEAIAGEPIVRVQVDTIEEDYFPKAVFAEARLCERLIAGSDHRVVTSPSIVPAMIDVEETELDFGNVTIGNGLISMRHRGQYYRPINAIAGSARPLIIIVHGWHVGFGFNRSQRFETSYLGYDYLARHLVQWGATVFSLDLQPINDHGDGAGDLRPPLAKVSAETSQLVRTELIFRTIDRLLEDPSVGPGLDPSRIGLVGHSMGGEAVAYAQILNEANDLGYSISGVAAIAPTNHLHLATFPAGNYMQIFGSLDQLARATSTNDIPNAGGGMRWYDRSKRDKTLFWIYGLRHNPFNSLWVEAGDWAELDIAPLALSESEHQRAAKTLIGAFFNKSLHNLSIYDPYMEGLHFPEAISHLSILTSHSKRNLDLIDNFGDEDEQTGVVADPNLDKTLNSQGLSVSVSGEDLLIWEDELQSSIIESPHVSPATRLAWNGVDAVYETRILGVNPKSNQSICLRAAQIHSDAELNTEGLPSDAFIRLSDGVNDATVRIGALSEIPFPDSTPFVKSTLRSFRIPLDAFKAANPDLNTFNPVSIALAFSAKTSGHIIVDDIEISD